MFLIRRFEPEWLSAIEFISFSIPKMKQARMPRVVTSLPPSRCDPLKAINTRATWDLWQSCQVCRPVNTAPWPRPSPYRWPPGETLRACPQGNGDGTRPKGLGHPAEGQGVNCPPLSPSRLWSSSGVEGLNQIFLSPPCLSFDGFPENQNKISTKHVFFSPEFGTAQPQLTGSNGLIWTRQS